MITLRGTIVDDVYRSRRIERAKSKQLKGTVTYVDDVRITQPGKEVRIWSRQYALRGTKREFRVYFVYTFYMTRPNLGICC